MRKTLIETYNQKGICQYIQEIIDLDWFTIDIALTLDTELYYAKSTDKYISPLFNNLIDNKTLDDAMIELAKNIVLKFRDNWDKIYDAYFNTIYKPLENYSMTEEENSGVNIQVGTDIKNKIYGFNNIEGSDSSSGSNTVTTTSDFDKNKRKLTRSGNIGVTTSQQMLTSELELREYNFYENVLKDIDSVICLSIYR